MQVIHFQVNSYQTPTRPFVTQELLHRSTANFQVIKLYLNSCNFLLLKFFYFCLAAGTARQWLTYGQMRVLFVLGQPSAEIARVGWGEMRIFFAPSNRLRRSCGRPNMWWKAIFFWARATLYRDRADRASKHVAKGKLNLLRRSAALSHEMRVNRQKLV